MNVAIHLQKGKRTINQHFVYAQMVDVESGETVISADLQYCLDAIRERGYTLTNAVDVLFQMKELDMDLLNRAVR